MITHPWHEAPSGYRKPYLVNAFIEISTGMRTKYEVDKATGLLKLDRILYSSVHYPANYGFIPQTMGEDKDPLDIMILCRESIVPMCLVPARIIGVMRMIDQDQTDDKILAVPVNDVATADLDDISGLEAGMQQELKDFFESYTKLENKVVTVPEFLGKEIGCKLIEKALTDYRLAFPLRSQSLL